MSGFPMMQGLNGVIDRVADIAGQAAGAMKEVGNMGNQLGMITQIVSLARKGGNPMPLITAFARQNPQAQQMLGNLQSKSDAELRQYAENMARSYGTDLNTVFNQLGLQMPK